MKRLIVLVTTSWLIIGSVSIATIINIPDDYSTIQEGIDASIDGDTVLVQPGTYVENVTILNHSIVLGSLFLTTGDTAYIPTTIIDGDSSGSVITLIGSEDSTTVISGFTIQDGYAIDGGGIYFRSFGITLSSLVIKNNYASNKGGGVLIRPLFASQNINIINCTFTGNNAMEGGGLAFWYVRNGATVDNCYFDGNTTQFGGKGGAVSLDSEGILVNNHCTITNCTITNSLSVYGGGIYVNQGRNIAINSCLIYGNMGTHGAGIFISENQNDSLVISNCTLSNNHSYANIGTLRLTAYCIVRNSIVSGNTSDGTNGGISFFGGSVQYSDICNNYPTDFSGSIPSGLGELVDVNANGDSCDVYYNIALNPLFCDRGGYNFHIASSSPCLGAGMEGGDIGALGEGCQNASRIINIPDDYATIQEGINTSFDGDTVLVQPGVYFENLNFNNHKIALGSLYLTENDSVYISQTIINGSGSESVVKFENAEDYDALLTGFTIRGGYAEAGGGIYCVGTSPQITHNVIDSNLCYSAQGGMGGGIYSSYGDPIIKNNTLRGNTISGPLGGNGGAIYCSSNAPVIEDNLIIGNTADGKGGGIYLDYSSPLIERNYISGNTGIFYGGGIYCVGSNPIISNNILFNNTADWVDGAGIFLDQSSPLIKNNVFFYNIALFEGGAVYCENSSNPTITNSILRWNDGDVNNEVGYDSTSSPIVSYSNVMGGWAGEGNIDVDPLFEDPFNGEFHLAAIECGGSENSPCIDAGNPNHADSLLDCSWGLGDIRSDMGAYGGGDSLIVGIDQQFTNLPQHAVLLQNYPNPFNAQTTIKYSLSEPANVKVEIFNILGQRAESFLLGTQPAGNHSITWNAKNNPSGAYFYRIKAGDYTETKKMVLLK